MSDDNRKGDWFQTFKGRKVWPLDPRPGDADLDEIIHALSNICRFNGHVPVFYSVAQHSVLVSRDVGDRHPELALEGLFHDAPEAYLGDVIRPLRRSGALTGSYFAAESQWGRVIAELIGLDPSRLSMIDPAVKIADDRLLLAERRDLMPNPELRKDWRENAYAPYEGKILPLSPVESEALFREEYEKLKGRL